MNYRHVYHAGNFADVVKHIFLMTILKSLQYKEKPFCYLDTHAGIGLYPLQSSESQKKQEFLNGIGKLFSLETHQMPNIISDYMHIVKKYNGDDLHFYPGSPLIAQHCLRQDDAMILCELHSEDVLTLKENRDDTKKISIHHTDGYLGMKAFLPPKQKRGLVMIDPPFEVTNEFEQIITALKNALKHWKSGHFMVWYPIKNKKSIDAFYRDINQLSVPYFITHFSLNELVEAGKLSECGILLINPPWLVKEKIENELIPYLSKTLNITFFHSRSH